MASKEIQKKYAGKKLDTTNLDRFFFHSGVNIAQLEDMYYGWVLHLPLKSLNCQTGCQAFTVILLLNYKSTSS